LGRLPGVAAEIHALGPDVRTHSRQGCVAFYRSCEFVAVRPGDGDLEIGLALDDPALEPAAGLGPERIRRKLRRAPDATLDHLGSDIASRNPAAVRGSGRRAYESSPW
jgi:hypothetical protein